LDPHSGGAIGGGQVGGSAIGGQGGSRSPDSCFVTYGAPVHPVVNIYA